MSASSSNFTVGSSRLDCDAHQKNRISNSIREEGRTPPAGRGRGPFAVFLDSRCVCNKPSRELKFYRLWGWAKLADRSQMAFPEDV